MKKKLVGFLFIILVVSLLISTCLGAQKKKVTIRFATWAGTDEAKELQEIIDQLNAKSQQYIIEQDSNPADYDTRLLTQLSGRGGPDLFWVSSQRAAQLSAKGVMLDITKMLASSKHEAANIADYFEASLEPFKVKDRIYGLPWIEQPVVLYVNRDLFDKANVTIPKGNWDWDKFLEVAQKLTIDNSGKNAGEKGFNKSAIKQWGFTVNGWPPAQIFVWQSGGDIIAPDFSCSPIDTPEAIRGFKFYADLINSPMVPSQQTIRDRGFDTMFRNQQVAMFMGGAADNLENRVDFRCEVIEVPMGPTGIKSTFADVLGMGINSKTKNPKAAFEALLDLTSAIHQWKVMPPRKSLATLETMNKLHPERSQAMQNIINSLAYAQPYRYFENYPDWDNIFWTQLMDPIVNNQGDPEELIPIVKPLLDEKLK